MTQHKKLASLLKRKRGVTAWEIIQIVGTVCPHKRMSDLKEIGWTITKQQVEGEKYHRYFGQGPKAKTAARANV
jgi:Helix-turn-helix domain